MIALLTAALLATTPVDAAPPAAAPPPPVIVAEPVDPARLAAAHEVVALAYPPETRAHLFDSAMGNFAPMMSQVMESRPEVKAQFDRDPRLRPIFDHYMISIRATVTAATTTALPALFAAYDRAYARRFTLAQLSDLKAFFATPTGRVYTSRALSLLGDPDVLAANRALMTRLFAAAQGDQQRLVAEIKALPPLPAAVSPTKTP